MKAGYYIGGSWDGKRVPQELLNRASVHLPQLQNAPLEFDHNAKPDDVCALDVYKRLVMRRGDNRCVYFYEIHIGLDEAIAKVQEVQV